MCVFGVCSWRLHGVLAFAAITENGRAHTKERPKLNLGEWVCKYVIIMCALWRCMFHVYRVNVDRAATFVFVVHSMWERDFFFYSCIRTRFFNGVYRLYFITTYNCTARTANVPTTTFQLQSEMTVELLFYFLLFFFNLPLLLLLLLTSVESMSTENKMDSTHNHQESFMCVLFFLLPLLVLSRHSRELVCGNNISYMQFQFGFDVFLARCRSFLWHDILFIWQTLVFFSLNVCRRLW